MLLFPWISVMVWRIYVSFVTFVFFLLKSFQPVNTFLYLLMNFMWYFMVEITGICYAAFLLQPAIVLRHQVDVLFSPQ
ncbi:hypothetical protein SAMN05660653_00711 [Desulfonatronum thiosulfatophilum]|uniref:Uncharacterized protein n=1 Tax=Desulfonatronum thiosulfatophilum TaxID=617002 RepID=A0A1G6B0U7_9BACT|nr:hypothetical protein SAMN05660653_00711 [Desulfonatronum thiosulfatophilum]